MNTTEKAWRVLTRKLMQANVRGPDRDPRGAAVAAVAEYRAARRDPALKYLPVRTLWDAAYSSARWNKRRGRC